MRNLSLRDRVRAIGCVALGGCVVVWSTISLAADTERHRSFELRDERGRIEVVAFAPRDDSSPRPVAIMLHGMCGAPERECATHADAVTSRAWLVCPRAPVPCEAGGHSWSLATTEQVIERALGRVAAVAAERIDLVHDRSLIGFSLGALSALQVAEQGRGRYRYVVLIGAKVIPDARRLNQAGVERIGLVAGDWDMMREHMWQQHQRLLRAGFPTVFASLGKIGHAYPPDMAQQMLRVLRAVWGERPVEGG